jgi:hypothetical protein
MPTPLSFDSAVLSCYVGAGITGSAWWDDISLTPLPLPLMQSYVLEPNYRGWMYGKYPSAFRLRLAVNYQENSLDNKNLRLRVLLTSSSGKEVFDISRGVEQREIIWSIEKPGDLDAGKYSLQISLVDKDNQTVLSKNEHSLVQWKRNAPEAKCWIDQYQRLIVDGKPFFPIAMFAGLPSEEDLERISDSAFNSLMPYFLYGQPIEAQKKYLEDSERLGIKTIYSTKDIYYENAHVANLHNWKGLVDRFVDPKSIFPSFKETILRGLMETFRDSPNIITWYINDERPLARLKDVMEHYNITREMDENRPIWVCDYRPEVARHWWGTSDVFGLVSYPIAWLPIDTVGKESAKARDQVFSARPRWDIPQAHNLQIYNPDDTSARSPTYEEMRNMAYQFLCNGATGLVFFCYDDLKQDPKATFDESWRDVKKVAAEFHDISPILLSPKNPLPIKVEGSESVRSFLKAYKKTTHVFVVNTAGASMSAKLILPSSGLNVSVDGIARKLTDDERTVQVDLPAIGVSHVEINR